MPALSAKVRTLMYGKFFSSTFTGSMYGSGSDVFAMWGYVIANTVDSMVELNPVMLAAVMGSTVERCEAAIQYLCSPDPKSRNEAEGGRRLIREGQYQYRVTNHEVYRAIRNEDERREYNREKQRESRARRVKADVIDKNSLSTLSAKAEAEAEASKVKPIVGLSPDPARLDAKKARAKQAVEILTFFNEKAGKHYPPTKANVDLIVGLLNTGFEPDRIRQVVAKKVREWKGKPEMVQYLRPATLFGPKNFSSKYVGEIPA